MDISIGQKVRKQRVFTRDVVQRYAELSGDFNPVHFDEDYARNTIFKKPIVHGPLVLTLVTTMFANDLPGPGSVYLSHDVQYIYPVYHDDIVTAELEVVNINEKAHIFISTVCTNQNGQIVMNGIARLKKY